MNPRSSTTPGQLSVGHLERNGDGQFPPDPDRSVAASVDAVQVSLDDSRNSLAPSGSNLWHWIAIARPSHHAKHVLILVGVALACWRQPQTPTLDFMGRIIAGLFAACLISSSNYVLNEILDAATDRHHPLKRNRPLVLGQIRPVDACVLWFALGTVGLTAAAWIGASFFAVAMTFQVMALAYNVPPVRLKELPYIDVLCEAINSPLRLLLGWTMVLASELPGLELILAFWMAGSFEMARKRLKEVQFFRNQTVAAAYRKSFLHYDATRLRASMSVYAASTVIFSLIAGRNLLLPPAS